MISISQITLDIFDLISNVSIGDTYNEFVMSDGGQMGEYYNYLLNAVFTDSQVPGAQALRFVTWLLEQGAGPNYQYMRSSNNHYIYPAIMQFFIRFLKDYPNKPIFGDDHEMQRLINNFMGYLEILTSYGADLSQLSWGVVSYSGHPYKPKISRHYHKRGDDDVAL